MDAIQGELVPANSQARRALVLRVAQLEREGVASARTAARLSIYGDVVIAIIIAMAVVLGVLFWSQSQGTETPSKLHASRLQTGAIDVRDRRASAPLRPSSNKFSADTQGQLRSRSEQALVASPPPTVQAKVMKPSLLERMEIRRSPSSQSSMDALNAVLQQSAILSDADAVDYLRAAHARMQGHPRLSLALAQRYVSEMRWDEANHYFRLACKHKIHDARCQYNVAVTYDRMGQRHNAIMHYGHAVNSRSGSAPAFDVSAVMRRMAELQAEHVGQ